MSILHYEMGKGNYMKVHYHIYNSIIALAIRLNNIKVLKAKEKTKLAALYCKKNLKMFTGDVLLVSCESDV